MRFIFLFLIVAMGAARADETPPNWALVCTTSVAGMSIFVDGEKVRFHFENPSGFQNFPVFSGAITPSMFPLVKRGMRELRAFNGAVDLAWLTKNCRVDKDRPTLISCSGLAEITNPHKIPKQLKMSVSSLASTTEYIESLDFGDAQGIHVSFGVNTAGGGHHFIDLSFDAKHCSKPKLLGEGV
jgi:hypothetical protein